MGGQGPPPKEPSARRRRNTPTAGEWVDIAPAQSKKRVLPALSTIERRKWSPRTKRLWDMWRDDPVTAMWGPAEIAACIELAYLHDEWVTGARDGSGAEIRLRSDGLGLTPKGKQQLRWRVMRGGQQPTSSPEPKDEVAARRDIRQRGVKAVAKS